MSGVWPGAMLPYVAALDKLARAVLGVTGASEVWIALAAPGAAQGEMTPVVGVSARPSGAIALDPASAPAAMRQAISRALRDGAGPHVQSGATPVDMRFAGGQAPAWGSVICALVGEGAGPIGALVAMRASAEPFTGAQRELAPLYASQIATTLRLVEAAMLREAQARELAALLDATRALTSGLDARGVINSIASHITRVIACDAALIYRFDERAQVLRLVAGLGVDAARLAGATISIQDQRSIAAWVASKREHRYNVTVRPEEQAGALTGALATKGAVSLVCEPLVAQNRLLGVVMLARAQAFDEGEQLAFSRFAAIAAAALERAGLYEETRAQRDQRDAMFSSASDGFALIGGDLRIIEVNQAFARYLGREPDTLHGQLCHQALNGTPGSPPSAENCLLCHGSCRAKACLEGEASSAAFECLFPPPRTPVPSGPAASAGPERNGRSVSFTLTPVAGPAGRQALLVGRDISDQRDLERRRMDFLTMLAHEVRQPLQSITSNLERALYYSPPDLSLEERKRFERQALGAAQHASGGLADLLTVSQRDFGLFTVEPIPGDLSQVAREAASELGALASNFGVDLSVKAPEGLPLAMIDLPRAKQVARNLLINAMKFTPAGGWTRISTREGHEKGRRWVVLEVADSGIGVPEEEQKRIFERRYQASTPGVQGRPKGTGMGLAIVRFIMAGHGGFVTVESAAGRGSRFSAHFPQA
ncbi:MAG TPA: ATP-binding protein [Ktedonobacterales bacterium]|nr:ATP-binding protein [Ktedonobacterales bacterium]